MKLPVFILGLALAAPVCAHKVVAISDGDVMTFLVDQKPIKVRLANIDAPEKGQPFWQASKRSLSELCLGKEAEYKEQDIDGHGNTEAVVFCDGIEANRAQVERGMAWVYSKQNKDLTLPGLEAMARRERKGLWQDADPVAPWVRRHPLRKAKSQMHTQSADGICFVDNRGEYRLVDGKRRAGCS